MIKTLKPGPNGEKVYDLGSKGFLKINLTNEQIGKYKAAFELKIGPDVKVIHDGTFVPELGKLVYGAIMMERGINLFDALNQKVISANAAKTQILELQRQLKQRKLGHCDIKLENCLYFLSYKQILLIDNGEIASYGDRREVHTPGINTTALTGHPSRERHIVGDGTDEKGFQNILKFISNWEMLANVGSSTVRTVSIKPVVSYVSNHPVNSNSNHSVTNLISSEGEADDEEEKEDLDWHSVD